MVDEFLENLIPERLEIDVLLRVFLFEGRVEKLAEELVVLGRIFLEFVVSPLHADQLF